MSSRKNTLFSLNTFLFSACVTALCLILSKDGQAENAKPTASADRIAPAPAEKRIMAVPPKSATHTPVTTPTLAPATVPSPLASPALTPDPLNEEDLEMMDEEGEAGE